MAYTVFDSSVLFPLAAMLTALMSLAIFDFYAFSPRPSGVAKRSRELAPMLTIALALGLATLTLFLPGNLTNDAMHTLQAERLRLLSYPLVITNVFESPLLGVALLTSAYFTITRIGLLGWSLVVLTVTLMTGVIAVVANPSGNNYGPFELILGLAFASTYAFSRQRVSKRRERVDLTILTVTMLVAAADGALTASPLRPELLLAALFTATAMTAFLFHLTRVAGPHWEATSLFFVSGLGTFVVAGFTLAIGPHFFDSEQWRTEVATSRAALHLDLVKTLRPIEFGAGPTPENENLVAERLAAGATRLRYLTARAELANELGDQDRETVHELKSLEQKLRILEKLHASRALVADGERRTSAATISSVDPARVDPMAAFWQRYRPWMLGELLKMKAEKSVGDALFLASIETDLDRLTRAAVEVEIHRVDVWVDWAARQPRELVPALKQTANEQIARLDALVVVTEPLPLQKDSRFYSLHQNLRKMASVSESKWE